MEPTSRPVSTSNTPVGLLVPPPTACPWHQRVAPAPATGRFISRDPVAGYTASPQSLNGYAYAMSNPVMRSDPTGMASQPAMYVTPQGEYTGDFNRYASEFRRSRDGVDGAGKGRVQATYHFQFGLGFFTPERAMHVLQMRWNDLFPPFNHTDCGPILVSKKGQPCVASKDGEEWSILIASVEPTFFRFIAQPGHGAGAGATIQFWAYQSGPVTTLDINAFGGIEDGWFKAGASLSWPILAARLSVALLLGAE